MEHLGNVEHRLEEMILSEKSRWEQEKEKLLERLKDMEIENEECKSLIKDMRNAEKLRSSAEKQVIFNEAIRKAVETKDKQIEDLETSLAQKTQRDNQAMVNTLEEQMADVQR